MLVNQVELVHGPWSRAKVQLRYSFVHGTWNITGNNSKAGDLSTLALVF
jgi:hypothetical protein